MISLHEIKKCSKKLPKSIKINKTPKAKKFKHWGPDLPCKFLIKKGIYSHSEIPMLSLIFC